MGKDLKWLGLVLVLILLIVGGLLLILRPGSRNEWVIPEKILVCLDPGHGGSDPGAAVNGRLEKDDNLRMALAVKEKLDALGYDRLTVMLTREDDTALELQQRVDLANNAEATLFVAIHRNTGGGQGVETWISSAGEKNEKRLAKHIQDGLCKIPDTVDRGVKSGTAADPNVSYTVVGRTEMPACLIELGFMDDTLDAGLFDSAFDGYANAIADGILKMLELQ